MQEEFLQMFVGRPCGREEEEKKKKLLQSPNERKDADKLQRSVKAQRAREREREKKRTQGLNQPPISSLCVSRPMNERRNAENRRNVAGAALSLK